MYEEKETKSVSHCVRMTPTVENIVLSNGTGEGFNVKFESIVLDFHNTMPDRKKELNKINQQIKARTTELARLTAQCRKLGDITFNVSRVVDQIEIINKQVDGYAANNDAKTEINEDRGNGRWKEAV
jgi:hypothetical protein